MKKLREAIKATDIDSELNSKLENITKSIVPSYKDTLPSNYYQILYANAINNLRTYAFNGVLTKEQSDEVLTKVCNKVVKSLANQMLLKAQQPQEKEQKETTEEKPEEPQKSSSPTGSSVYSKEQIFSMGRDISALIKDNLKGYARLLNKSKGFEGQKRGLKIYTKKYLTEKIEERDPALREALEYIKKLKEAMGSFTIEYVLGVEITAKEPEASEEDFKNFLDVVRNNIIDLINKNKFKSGENSYTLDASAGKDNVVLSPTSGEIYIKVLREAEEKGFKGLSPAEKIKKIGNSKIMKWLAGKR